MWPLKVEGKQTCSQQLWPGKRTSKLSGLSSEQQPEQTTWEGYMRNAGGCKGFHGATQSFIQQGLDLIWVVSRVTDDETRWWEHMNLPTDCIQLRCLQKIITIKKTHTVKYQRLSKKVWVMTPCRKWWNSKAVRFDRHISRLLKKDFLESSPKASITLHRQLESRWLVSYVFEVFFKSATWGACVVGALSCKSFVHESWCSHRHL